MEEFTLNMSQIKEQPTKSLVAVENQIRALASEAADLRTQLCKVIDEKNFAIAALAMKNEELNGIRRSRLFRTCSAIAEFFGRKK